MKRIFVRKIFPYDPTINGKYSSYDGYRKITLREEDPGIIFQNELKIPENLNTIFCSELKRAIESANAYNDNNLEIRRLSELNEILFDLSQLVSQREFEMHRSNLVRERFVERFIKDQLLESRAVTKGRVVKLLNELVGLPSGNYLLLSHSFFMKIFETSLIDSRLFERPEIIKRHLDVKEKTYEFGEGFDFRL